MSVTTFTPKDVALDIGGYRVTDWNSITIIPDQKTFTPHKGIKGKNTRVRTQDSSVILLVSVVQSGKANEVFSKILSLDKLYGTARLEVYCKYLNGGDAFSSATGYLTGEPETVYSETLNERVWEIVFDDVSSLPTSNSNSLTSNILNYINKIF